MYTVRVKSEFAGAHILKGHGGKCESLHGHNWVVEAEASSKNIDKLGMIVDFKEMKDTLEDVFKSLDHKYLNDLEYFSENNPTAEHIAKYIFKNMKEKKPALGLTKITVWETDRYSATYSE